MVIVKWYSIIMLILIEFMSFDEYVKERTKETLMAFIVILPIIFYLLVG